MARWAVPATVPGYVLCFSLFLRFFVSLCLCFYVFLCFFVSLFLRFFASMVGSAPLFWRFRRRKTDQKSTKIGAPGHPNEAKMHPRGIQRGTGGPLCPPRGPKPKKDQKQTSVDLPLGPKGSPKRGPKMSQIFHGAPKWRFFRSRNHHFFEKSARSFFCRLQGGARGDFRR